MSEAFAATTVDLLRHGEPAGGVKFRGHTDDPLSELGWEQMRAATENSGRWEAIVSSPLRRCAEFAASLAERRGIPLELEPRFKEIGFGQWEGRSAEELMRQDPRALERFWQEPLSNAPPGGENLDAFMARVLAAWNDLLARHAGKQVLVVGHGGVNRVIICHALQMPPNNLFRLEMPLAGLSRLRMHASGGQLLPQLVFHGAPQP